MTIIIIIIIIIEWNDSVLGRPRHIFGRVENIKRRILRLEGSWIQLYIMYTGIRLFVFLIMAHSCETTMWVQNLLPVAAYKDRPDVVITGTIEELSTNQSRNVELRWSLQRTVVRLGSSTRKPTHTNNCFNNIDPRLPRNVWCSYDFFQRLLEDCLLQPLEEYKT